MSDKKRVTIMLDTRIERKLRNRQSKEIMDKYGGCIIVTDRIESEPKSGAAFKLWLPIAEEL